VESLGGSAGIKKKPRRWSTGEVFDHVGMPGKWVSHLLFGIKVWEKRSDTGFLCCRGNAPTFLGDGAQTSATYHL
jgi:hypothetical protein